MVSKVRSGRRPRAVNGGVPNRFPPGSIEQRTHEMFAKLPASLLRKLPKDGATNHDYYLYGLPKRKP